MSAGLRMARGGMPGRTAPSMASPMIRVVSTEVCEMLRTKIRSGLSTAYIHR